MTDIDIPPRPPKVPKGQVRRIYNLAERAVIDPFKVEYRHAGSPQARKQIFVSRIWPAIYLYWHERHSDDAEEDFAMKAQALAKWLHNTWRPHNTGGRNRSILSIRKPDVIWATRRDDVMKEIAIILGVPVATTSTEGWFESRTPAIRRILSRMTAEETRQLEEDIKEIERVGYPEEERRKLANKHCTRRLDDSAKAHWLEMGALTISFVAYVTPDGQLGVEIIRHDIAAPLANVSQDTFEDLHPSPVREIQRLWLEYVRDILNKKNGVTPTANVPGQQDLSIGYDEEGYPLLPSNLNVDKLNKKISVRLLRDYLKEHHKLATYRQNSHVPYGYLAKKPKTRRQFVKDKYLPKGFTLKDPHNMTLAEVKTFLQFLLDRQSALPSSEVFLFCGVKTARKGGEIVKSMYPHEIDPNNPPIFKKGKKNKQRAGIPNDSSDSNESQHGEHPHGSEVEYEIANQTINSPAQQGLVPLPPASALSPHTIPQIIPMPGVGHFPGTQYNDFGTIQEPMAMPNVQSGTTGIGNSNVQNVMSNPMMYSQNRGEYNGHGWNMDVDAIGWLAQNAMHTDSTQNAMDLFGEHMWPTGNIQGTGSFNTSLLPSMSASQMPMLDEFGLSDYDFGGRQDNSVDYGVKLNMPPTDNTTQHYEQGQSNARLDVNANADADADTTADPLPRSFIAGSSGIMASVKAQKRKKTGRRADDLAREEAEVLGGRIGDKRPRKTRVRES